MKLSLTLDWMLHAEAEKELRDEHRRLEQLLDRLSAAKNLPTLLATAEELRQALLSHFAHEEYPGGLYDCLQFCLPQHRKELAQLIQDHRDLTAAVWELCQRARDPKPSLPTLRKETAQIVKKFHLHEKIEFEIAHQPLRKGPAHRA